MNFEDLLESEYETLTENDILTEEEAEEYLYSIQEELGLEDEDIDEIMEELRKRVTSTGNVSRVRSKATRKKRATRTTKMSRSALRRRGRKAAKTRKRNPGAVKKSTRKRKKAIRRRRQMGLS